jgi:hypothetical protein
MNFDNQKLSKHQPQAHPLMLGIKQVHMVYIQIEQEKALWRMKAIVL